MTYNAFSEVYRDERNNATTYTYDNYGNQTSTKDPLNNVTTYTHTAQGLVRTEVDALGVDAGLQSWASQGGPFHGSSRCVA